MFEINLFNSAQIFDQIFAFVCVYLLTSLSAKVRFYGFVVGTIGFVPGIYLLIETELWWLLAAMPLWVFINYKGLVNNWREFKGRRNYSLTTSKAALAISSTFFRCSSS